MSITCQNKGSQSPFLSKGQYFSQITVTLGKKEQVEMHKIQFSLTGILMASELK